ncbi:uncharacterized protein B0P05DRAFT_550659 [Gilbertella persicaria]|uniref:uncharacterized protein n=1 Tax=Gilbertella persicaria TaxID=101096 RepID=UPI00221EB502|nr:uncharacterized protein B0P05DRAFT_550659 [Gilbertella persicaria]KAI8069743.1 hypothetical protein B0P05DRAFT_550659 [Gilbertella persicaria]
MVCFWALLSTELEFIYTSYYSLDRHSLWDFIHPEEVLLAKRDLVRFIQTNQSNGSVTRCRLKDYTNNSSLDWIVVDMTMYVATQDLVLAFFHPIQEVSCQEQPNCYHLREALIHRLHRNLPSPSLSTSSSISSSSSQPIYPDTPYQSLSIMDTRYQSIVLSWPEETDRVLDVHLSSDKHNGCSRYIQPQVRLISGQRIERLVIEYGTIGFILTRIDKIQTHISFEENSNKQQQYQRNHCQSCGTDSSPEWRRGPTGHKTLCNACGLRYSRSVARQGKKQKQHSLIQSQNTPHYHPY